MMAGLENILSDFLSSPENMRALTDMASSLGIDLPDDAQPPAQMAALPASGLIEGLTKADETSALLAALKPFLSRDMAQKVENTVTAARIAQAAGGFIFKNSP